MERHIEDLNIRNPKCVVAGIGGLTEKQLEVSKMGISKRQSASTEVPFVSPESGGKGT